MWACGATHRKWEQASILPEEGKDKWRGCVHVLPSRVTCDVRQSTGLQRWRLGGRDQDGERLQQGIWDSCQQRGKGCTATFVGEP